MSRKTPGEVRARTCGTKSPSRSEALRFIDSSKSPSTKIDGSLVNFRRRLSNRHGRPRRMLIWTFEGNTFFWSEDGLYEWAQKDEWFRIEAQIIPDSPSDVDVRCTLDCREYGQLWWIFYQLHDGIFSHSFHQSIHEIELDEETKKSFSFQFWPYSHGLRYLKRLKMAKMLRVRAFFFYLKTGFAGDFLFVFSASRVCGLKKKLALDFFNLL